MRQLQENDNHIQILLAQNKKLNEELTALRAEQQQAAANREDEIAEARGAKKAWVTTLVFAIVDKVRNYHN